MRRCALILLLLFQGTVVAKNDIRWLETHSMLFQASELAKLYSGKKEQWQHPYAYPNPKRVIDKAPNWFTAYPASILTDEDETVLDVLGSDALWSCFKKIGLSALHTGSMKMAGGLKDGALTPSTDGGFDRIGYQIDPIYGTLDQYLAMTQTAEKHKGLIIGDLVPGHTGLGPDFLLAISAYKNYPGIYHMVEIEKKDWYLLPKVKRHKLTANLSKQEVRELKKRGYIVGLLERVIFSSLGIKETNWSATKCVTGVDGKKRRWVYLHYFKETQPTLNWLDPTFAANRITASDAIVSMEILKNQGVRLDANGFLGIEGMEKSYRTFSEGHPLSVNASDQIAQFVRKLGGFSFQELNLGLSTTKAFLEAGADLTYDFYSRAAVINSLIHQNVDLLKLSYLLLRKCNLQPISFVHAMQNHDEYNYELIHLKELYDMHLPYHGCDYTAHELIKKVQREDAKVLMQHHYNFFNGESPCGTLTSIAGAALGVKDVYNMSQKEKEEVKRAHLLVAFFNAMQPGVFAISGWDLVGALPIRKEEIRQKIEEDQDSRWANRGAYDLLGNADYPCSKSGLMQAECLYGSIKKQLKNSHSFVSKLRHILNVRRSSNIATSTLIDVIPSSHPSVLLLLHRLDGTGYLELTAINFGRERISEELLIKGTSQTSAINLMTRKLESKSVNSDILRLELEALSGKAIVFQTAR